LYKIYTCSNTCPLYSISGNYPNIQDMPMSKILIYFYV
jgi:hypothetical protein